MTRCVGLWCFSSVFLKFKVFPNRRIFKFLFINKFYNYFLNIKMFLNRQIFKLVLVDKFHNLLTVSWSGRLPVAATKITASDRIYYLVLTCTCFPDQGNTAVYLLYAHARICSIMKKSGKNIEELMKVSSSATWSCSCLRFLNGLFFIVLTLSL